MSLREISRWVMAALLLAVSHFISVTEREDFLALLIAVGAGFLIYGWFFSQRNSQSIPFLIVLAGLVRLPFFFELPGLSDDFYRFLWDGMRIYQGFNPLGEVPSRAMIESPFGAELLKGMNSSDYASVYPPLHQFIFALGYNFSGNDLLMGVNFFRASIILSELFGLFYFIRKSTFWCLSYVFYLLNPLVFIEGAGNVHFEAFYIPLLAIGLHSFIIEKKIRASLFWSLSILIKLTPILLMPIFAFRQNRREAFSFLGFAAFIILLGFIPFMDWNLLKNWDDGMGLYFQKFEFNASVYYILSFLGKAIQGYNPIAQIGPLLAILTLVAITVLSYRFRKADLIEISLIAFITYLLFATTVHSWYVIPIVFLAIASGRYLILIWSMTVFLSYSHYLSPVSPKWLYITIEYISLFMAIYFEQQRRKWLQPALRG